MGFGSFGDLRLVNYYEWVLSVQGDIEDLYRTRGRTIGNVYIDMYMERKSERYQERERVE